MAGTDDKTKFNEWCKQTVLHKLLDLSGTKLSEKEKREHLQNLKLQLECFKMIREQFPAKSFEEILAVINGSESLPTPALEQLQKKICDICQHEHDATTNICKVQMCFCGVR